MDLIARARDTLERIVNAALATVSPDGQPWNSPIFVAWSRSRTIYWSSLRDTVHSQNIATRPDVFLVVFDAASSDQSGHAVYIRATAHELSDEAAVQAALDCLASRKKGKPKPAAEFLGEHPRRVYEAVPETIWTNVVKMENGHYFDERVVVDIQSLRPPASAG
ncbi:MAG TPA: pyridoxamine 5'-phosphate oxidase family protein [Vicinamibacterales bacterium]|jgi:nitroimidazol reductase NimA-like FMN-containing flavoprotein (pyridoxamine 5'-phosphate oxidase superfamily)